MLEQTFSSYNVGLQLAQSFRDELDVYNRVHGFQLGSALTLEPGPAVVVQQVAYHQQTWSSTSAFAAHVVPQPVQQAAPVVPVQQAAAPVPQPVQHWIQQAATDPLPPPTWDPPGLPIQPAPHSVAAQAPAPPSDPCPYAAAHDVALLQEMVEASEEKLKAFDVLAAAVERRLVALEAIRPALERRLDAVEASQSALDQRFASLESIPALDPSWILEETELNPS